MLHQVNLDNLKPFLNIRSTTHVFEVCCELEETPKPI